MHTVTESIYSGSVIVPLADVQHIEPRPKNSVPGIFVITKNTGWSFDRDEWNNAIWISDPEAIQFTSALCRYRSELEANSLADLSPDAKNKFVEEIVDCVLANFGVSKSGLDGNVKSDEFDDMYTYTVRSIVKSIANRESESRRGDAP